MAVQTLDAQGAALSETVLPLLEAHDQRLGGLDTAVQHLGSLISKHAETSVQFYTLRFLQRVNWLLTGRLP